MSMKKLFLALVLCTVVSSSAFATVARVVGLGGSGVNYIVKDHLNATVWPALLHHYGNQAGAEVYGGDLMKVYVNYGFGEKKSVLQFSLDKVKDNHGYTLMPDIDNAGQPANALSLTYARPLGDDWLIGLALNYAGESVKNDAYNNLNNATDNSESIMGLKLGASCQEMNLDLALGIEIASFAIKSGGATVQEDNGDMAFNVDARWWWNYAENKASLIPNLHFKTQKDAAKAPSGGTNPGNAEHNMTATTLAIGAGHNWWPASNVLVVFDFGLNFWSLKHEYVNGGTALIGQSPFGADFTQTMSAVPYWRAGMEGKILEWLDGRFGAERNWQSTGITDVNGDPMTWAPETHTYLGATAHWNRLWLDMHLNPALLNNGLDFVSGTPTQLNSRVSLTYKFD